MDEENNSTQDVSSDIDTPGGVAANQNLDANINLPYGKYDLNKPVEITLPASTPTSNQPGSTEPAPNRFISGDVSVTSVGRKNGRTYWKVEYPTDSGSGLYAWIDATNLNKNSVDNNGVLKNESDYNYLTTASDEAEYLDAQRAGRENEMVRERLEREAAEYDYLADQYLGNPSNADSAEFILKQATYKVANYVPRDISGLDVYLKKMTRIFGLPPQWSPYADVRIGASGSTFQTTGEDGSVTETSLGRMIVGRRYAETILGCPTILAMCPGRLVPAEGLNNSLGDAAEDVAALGESLASGQAEPFWKFEENWNNGATTGGAYVNCCNVLCRYAAICLSVGEDKAQMPNGGEIKLSDKSTPWGGSSYADMSVEEFLDPGSGMYSISGGDGIGGILHRYIQAASNLQRKFVYFNANGGITVGDEFNTETRQSVIEQMINGGISSTMKDIAFMVGDQVTGAEVQGDLDALKDLATSALGGTIGSLVSSATEIIHGGVIAFPQIIDSCTWGRTFTFTVKFASMYGDVESRFLNVVMPYLCLAAFFLPRQLKNAIDMYTYPPVVRAFARGVYACDCGVVTGVSAKRGGEDDTAWTASGQPMEIDVTFSIKSLHQNLMQSDSEFWFRKNTGMQMYIGTLCGIDMTMQQTELIQATIAAFKNHIFEDIKRDVSYGIWHDIQMSGLNGILNDKLNW